MLGGVRAGHRVEEKSREGPGSLVPPSAPPWSPVCPSMEAEVTLGGELRIKGDVPSDWWT